MLHVHLASDTQKFQSSDWSKWLCVLWRHLFPVFCRTKHYFRWSNKQVVHHCCTSQTELQPRPKQDKSGETVIWVCHACGTRWKPLTGATGMLGWKPLTGATGMLGWKPLTAYRHARVKAPDSLQACSGEGPWQPTGMLGWRPLTGHRHARFKHKPLPCHKHACYMCVASFPVYSVTGYNVLLTRQFYAIWPETTVFHVWLFSIQTGIDISYQFGQPIFSNGNKSQFVKIDWTKSQPFLINFVNYLHF